MVNLAGWQKKGLLWNRLCRHLLKKKKQQTRRLPSHACLSGPCCVSLTCSRYQMRRYSNQSINQFPSPLQEGRGPHTRQRAQSTTKHGDASHRRRPYPWSHGPWGKDNKRIFYLMRIICHCCINLIDVMGPFQQRKLQVIRGHFK